MDEPQIVTNERGDVAVVDRGVDKRIKDLAAEARAVRLAQHDKEDGIAEADPPDGSLAWAEDKLDEERSVLHAQLRAELDAIEACASALAQLDATAQQRALRWLMHRYGSFSMKASVGL